MKNRFLATFIVAALISLVCGVGTALSHFTGHRK